MTKKGNALGRFFSDAVSQLPPVNRRQFLIRAIPFVAVFYLGDKFAWLYQYCQGQTTFVRVFNLLANVQLAFQKPLFSFKAAHMLTGLVMAVILIVIIEYKTRNAKKYRQGMEYGSARWGTARDIAPFIDPVYENNILLTATERLTMNSRPKLAKNARNKNVLVIGGSGSGKTRFYVKPNLMQMHPKSSYIVTDPKGSLIVECGRMLERGGYRIKALNTLSIIRRWCWAHFPLKTRNMAHRK